MDAPGLPGHAPPCPPSPASSLARTHWNDSVHVGQPSPTYSTVLSAVWPHVVTVSVPPSGAPGPRLRKYTSRGAPKKVEKEPAGHEPDVYSPGVPHRTTSTRGATPDAPASVVTLVTGGRHMALGDGVRGGVRLPVALPVGVPVPDGEGVPVVELVSVALGDGVAVAERVAVELAVADAVRDAVALTLAEGVCDSDRDAVGDVVPEGVPEPVADAERLRLAVALLVAPAVSDAVPVSVALDVALPVAVRLPVVEPVGVRVGDCVAVLVGVPVLELEPVVVAERVADAVLDAERVALAVVVAERELVAVAGGDADDDSDGSAPGASPRNTGMPSSRTEGLTVVPLAAAAAARRPASQAAPPPPLAWRTPALTKFDGTSWLTLDSSTHGADGCDGDSSSPANA